MSSYNKNRLLKKGGYVADYAKVSTPADYTIYVPPVSGSSSSEGAVLVSNQATATPGMTNGGSKCSGGNVDLPNNFYYSMKGGCALCNSGGNAYKKGGNKNLKGGFGLEPFITALALLGARMLADKEVGLFNNDKNYSKRSKYDVED